MMPLSRRPGFRLGKVLVCAVPMAPEEGERLSMAIMSPAPAPLRTPMWPAPTPHTVSVGYPPPGPNTAKESESPGTDSDPHDARKSPFLVGWWRKRTQKTKEVVRHQGIG